MKKIILMGRSEAGKTTLTQALKGEKITYKKTQYINHYDVIIDTPGEYLYSSRSGIYSQHSRDLMEVIDTPQLQMFRSTHEGANVLCCSRKVHALYFPAQQ